MSLVLVLDDKRVPLDRSLLLGGDAACDVVVGGLSARHARIEPGDDRTIVRAEPGCDVVVNEVPVADGEARTLLPGDRVQFGPTSGKVAYEETVAPARTAELALAAMRRQRVTPQVMIVQGASLGAHVDLGVEGEAVRVGRARDCDWQIDDPSLSRAHVRFVLRGGRVLVRDLDSSRGTFLGNARLEPQKDTAWEPGRSLRIGSVVLSLLMPVTVAEAVDAIVQVMPREEAVNVGEQPIVAIAAPQEPLVEAPVAKVEETASAARLAPRKHRVAIVVGLGAVFILGCVLILLWIFGVFALRTSS